jgi:hypothetical protein
VAQVRKVVESHKPATSVVAEVRRVAESLRPATSVVAGEKRTLLADLAMAEANVRRAIAARRAGALPRAALAVRGVRRAAAAVHHGAVAVVPVGAAAVVADVDEQEWEIRNKRNSDED